MIEENWRKPHDIGDIWLYYSTLKIFQKKWMYSRNRISKEDAGCHYWTLDIDRDTPVNYNMAHRKSVVIAKSLIKTKILNYIIPTSQSNTYCL